MADFTKFRSSMGGFNRSDVTNYIETLCLEHHQTAKKLREERDSLSAQLSQTALKLEEKTAAAEALQQKLAETETALSVAEDSLSEALTRIGEQQPQEEAPDYSTMELEAYRRAEAAERLASERAARLRQRLDDLISAVSARYEQSGQELQVLSEDLQTNLRRLQETLSDLEVTFQEANTGFDSLEDDELTEA